MIMIIITIIIITNHYYDYNSTQPTLTNKPAAIIS